MLDYNSVRQAFSKWAIPKDARRKSNDLERGVKEIV